MKKICILAHGRTGSSFLADCFDHIKGESFNSGEFFNYFVPHQFTIIKNLFIVHGLPLSWPYYDFLWRLAPCLINNKGPTYKIKRPWIEMQPYSIEMFQNAIKTLQELNYNYFIYKIAPPPKNKYDISTFLPEVINSSDHIILLYRENLLDVHISFLRAKKINQWQSNEYKPEYDTQVFWGLQQYEDRLETYKTNYTNYFEMLNKYKKSYTILKYEDINTVDLATAALKNIDKEYPLKTPNFVKQSRSRKNVEDNFVNPEDFLIDLPKIQTKFRIEECINDTVA